MTMPELSDEQLEDLWERLAQAIEAAGPERTPLFLSKLVLLMGRALGEPAEIERLIAVARADL